MKREFLLGVVFALAPTGAHANLIQPIILAQPVAVTAVQGKPATFSVKAYTGGPLPLSYQWKKNGVAIAGANATSYSIAAVSSADAGSYSVTVANRYASTTSASAALTVVYPPAITQQPVSSSVIVGGIARFSVGATGTGPLSYQWQKNGLNIPGANQSSYVVYPVTVEAQGSYRVLVSNAYGSVFSTGAMLTALAIPVVYSQPSPGICDSAKGVTGGYLCAIRPSRLDPAARDQYGSATLQDARLGFGYHAMMFPNNDRGVKGVYIHLTGSYGRPYDQRTAEYGSENFFTENVSSGYVMIQVAYDNRFQVNEDTCVPHSGLNNCAGLVRQEKLTGQDVFPYAVTPIADAIETRIRKLAAYFDSRGVQLPVALVVNGQVNWKALRVGGHSQGSGHAYYIAKNKGVSHACFLGGPYDVPDTVNASLIADWFKVPGSVTPVSSMRAAVSRDDGSYNHFTYAYGLMGLRYGYEWFDVDAVAYADSQGNPIDGHAAILKDPRYASLRTQVCFR